jgi:O-antigen biosynthesis protein
MIFPPSDALGEPFPEMNRARVTSTPGARTPDLEIEGPLSVPDGCLAAPGHAVRALVRVAGRPAGFVLLPTGDARVRNEEELRAEIERQIGPALRRVTLERRLAGNSSPVSAVPTVTVAVCTRERPESLARTLRSLERIDYPDAALEVVVIDNASRDDTTRDVVSAHPRFRCLREPRPGLDRARNLAVAEARSEIVAFTDDDVEVDPGWVGAIAPHFANPAVMAVTGLVAPAVLETRAERLFETYGGFGRGFEVRYYTPAIRRYWRFWPLGAGIYGTGCNMAFRRSFLAGASGFDPALDVGTPTWGGGDLDMFYRTLRGGHVLVYEPRALVWHHHRREEAELRRQLRGFGRGLYAFWTKTMLSDHGMRLRTFEFAVRWYLGGILGRVVRPRGLTRSVALAQAWGAIEGPFAYLVSRWAAR